MVERLGTGNFASQKLDAAIAPKRNGPPLARIETEVGEKGTHRFRQELGIPDLGDFRKVVGKLTQEGTAFRSVEEDTPPSEDEVVSKSSLPVFDVFTPTVPTLITSQVKTDLPEYSDSTQSDPGVLLAPKREQAGKNLQAAVGIEVKTGDVPEFANVQMVPRQRPGVLQVNIAGLNIENAPEQQNLAVGDPEISSKILRSPASPPVENRQMRQLQGSAGIEGEVGPASFNTPTTDKSPSQGLFFRDLTITEVGMLLRQSVVRPADTVSPTFPVSGIDAFKNLQPVADTPVAYRIQLLPRVLGVVVIEIERIGTEVKLVVETVTREAQQLLTSELPRMGAALKNLGLVAEAMDIRHNPNLEMAPRDQKGMAGMPDFSANSQSSARNGPETSSGVLREEPEVARDRSKVARSPTSVRRPGIYL